MAADTETIHLPGKLGAHELVLLHGQPGSAADWQQVTGRLPAQLHAVAADRPGYGSSPIAAGGFAANARAVLDDLDSRGIQRVVLVGHSYGGGVALSAASCAPHRVEAIVLLASVGPGCVNAWDKLLAAPGAGPLCALVAWRLTPWIARGLAPASKTMPARARISPIMAGASRPWPSEGRSLGGRDRPGRLVLGGQLRRRRDVAVLGRRRSGVAEHGLDERQPQPPAGRRPRPEGQRVDRQQLRPGERTWPGNVVVDPGGDPSKAFTEPPGGSLVRWRVTSAATLPDPDEPYEVIHLGGATAAIVPLTELRRPGQAFGWW